MSILKITLVLLAFAIVSFPYLYVFYLYKKGQQKQPERFEENDGLNHDFEAYERGEFPTPDNMITPELIRSLAQSKGYRVGESANGFSYYVEIEDLHPENDIYFFKDQDAKLKKDANIEAFRLLERVIKITGENK